MRPIKAVSLPPPPPPPLYLTFPLLYLPDLIFHTFQGPTIKFRRGNEFLKFLDLTGFQRPARTKRGKRPSCSLGTNPVTALGNRAYLSGDNLVIPNTADITSYLHTYLTSFPGLGRKRENLGNEVVTYRAPWVTS